MKKLEKLLNLKEDKILKIEERKEEDKKNNLYRK